eukprot:NODE_611_length_6023_cov_0.126435.p2 type:complete len:240 gc:universal NODE_611_length_6023_cov_0.126435:4253-4972(+)
MQRIAVNTLKVKNQASNRTGNQYRNTRYGKGSNGQLARHHVKIGFNGSTIPFWKRFPKIGSLTNKNFELYGVHRFQTLNLTQFVLKMDRLDKIKLVYDSENRPMIHTLDLYQTNIIHKLVPLAVVNGTKLTKPIHLVTQRITASAAENIKNAGGTVTVVYNTKVGLDQLHKRVYLNYLKNQPESYLLHQLRKYSQVPPNFLVGKYNVENGYLNENHRKLLPQKGIYPCYIEQSSNVFLE